MKKCSKCKIIKKDSEFYFRTNEKRLLQSRCKKCLVEDAKIYKLKNKNKIIKYREKNREKTSAKMKIYYIANKERINESASNYRAKNVENIKEYYIKNRGKIIEKAIEYQKNNPEKIKISMNKWRKANTKIINQYAVNRLRTNPKHYLNSKMSKNIRKSLKGNKAGRHWENLVGYTLNDLIKRLKMTMPENYNWQDFLDGKLHLDHIIPISAYDSDKPGDFQFRECWALNNLRLLPAKENLIKWNKIIKSYQLALKL